MNDWNDDAVVPDCHCQHVSGGRCMFAASPPKPEPLTPERLAAIGKVSYEPTIDQLAIKGRIARGAADYEGFLMAMSPYVRVEESVREAHAGSRSADSSATPDADAPVPEITNRDVWRAWVSAMDRQGRVIDPERQLWETLPQQERDLDADIAYQLNRVSGRTSQGDADAPVGGLDADRLRCGQCGDDVLPGEVEGHLISEGRTMTVLSSALDVGLLREAFRTYTLDAPDGGRLDVSQAIATTYNRLAAATSIADAPVGGLADLTAGEVAEWLDSSEGRIEDVFGLWVQGKRNSRWVAEQLIDEGHLRRLAAATSAGAGPSRYHSCAKHYPCEACVVGLWCDEHDGVRPVTTSSADA